MSALTVRFGALTALDGVILQVKPGEIVALAGENGAGKTTLIRAVGGDLTPLTGAGKKNPARGRDEIEGLENPTAENIAKLIFEFTVGRGFPVVEAHLWETPRCYATYRSDK